MRSYNVVISLTNSSVANRHLLKAIARVGAGSFEFYDNHSKFKSKWEDKVSSMVLSSNPIGNSK